MTSGDHHRCHRKLPGRQKSSDRGAFLRRFILRNASSNIPCRRHPRGRHALPDPRAGKEPNGRSPPFAGKMSLECRSSISGKTTEELLMEERKFEWKESVMIVAIQGTLRPRYRLEDLKGRMISVYLKDPAKRQYFS